LRKSNKITLREYVDVRFDAQKEAVNAALAAAQKAVDKSDAAYEERFRGVNEFRNALGDSARLNMPRTEAEQQFKSLAEKLEKLDERLAARENRGEGKGAALSLIASVVAVIASVVAIALAIRGIA